MRGDAAPRRKRAWLGRAAATKMRRERRWTLSERSGRVEARATAGQRCAEAPLIYWMALQQVNQPNRREKRGSRAVQAQVQVVRCTLDFTITWSRSLRRYRVALRLSDTLVLR